MGYFPFFMEIKGKDALVVGGGKVACRKAERLLVFGVNLTVVAPSIEKELLENPLVFCVERPFEEKDICGRMFVVAASGDPEVNRHVAELCRQRQIPVNVADDKEACSFLFPALIKEGCLTVGISTEGVSPALSGYLKGQIQGLLPEGAGDRIKELKALREHVREQIPDQEQRAKLLRKEALKCMRADVLKEGTVTLVGAGCGAYDLITLRGMRALQGAQAIIYDDLIDERLLSFAGESCERIYVGKRGGLPSTPQEKINEILIQKAKEGKSVVRLKGGDCFVFGRGGEEILALQNAGIRTEVVPGVSSATGVPGLAGIPVTYRGISQSFHVATARSAVPAKEAAGEDDFPEDLDKLASLNGTLVFLMGLGRLEELAARLIRYGKSPDTPAAVIKSGFDGNISMVRGCLGDIAGKVKEAEIKAPAVILVGPCAGQELK